MIDFKIENKGITQEEIYEFEREAAITLPIDYKEHMLKYNGGSPVGYNIYYGEPDDDICLFDFFPIKYGKTLAEKQDYLPEKYISIGKTRTGYLAMSLNEEEYGSIFVHYSECELTKIASSFTEFMEGLEELPDDFE